MIPRWPGTLVLGLAVALAGCGSSPAPDPVSEDPAPSVRTPEVRFAVKGDWGWGGPEQAAISRRVCGEHRRAPFRFLLTTGDNFTNPDGVATSTNYTEPERCIIRSGLRWRAAWGNHDLAGDSTATVLGSRRRWFTFTHGPLRVIVLDSNRPDDPAQLRFLRRVLRTARQPAIVVAAHHPTRTLGFHAPSRVQRRDWEPLFRRWGVSLVLQGHNHAYERLVVDGVTYITTGGGGAPVYPCVRFARGARSCRLAHHFLIVTADARRIRVVSPTRDGTPLERIVIPVRREAVGP